MVFVMVGLAFLTLLERKVLGYIHIRKVGFVGIFQPFRCAYVRMHIFMYVRTYVCIYVLRIYVCSYVCMPIGMYIPMYICMYVDLSC
jgi:NADH-ubiquinone oxidoreductase chain 1